MSVNRGRIGPLFARSGGPRIPESGALPLARTLWLAGALLAFALGVTWLVQRQETIEGESRFATRGQGLAEMVAQAACAESTFADAGRLERILAAAARQGGLLGGALVDDEGQIVAHTDLDRVGGSSPAASVACSDGAAEIERVRRDLFDGRPGRLFLHPMLDARGTAGAVALLLPEPPPAGLGRGWARTFLPAGLVVLAFLGLVQMTTRWALRPTAQFLDRLAGALRPAQPDAPAAAPGPSYEILERTVRFVEELQAERESLAIENRMLDYERRRAAQLLERVPDGLIHTDALGQPLLVNRAAAQLLGLPRPAGPDEMPELTAEARRSLAEAERTGRMVFDSASGDQARRILITRTALAGTQERGAASLYLLRDVTAQSAAQQAQAEFLSQISHELKSPLNTIVAYVEALADEEQLDPEERREFFNTLSAEAQRMARLISNLLQLSRIQLGNLSARFGYVKADALARGLADSVAPQAAARGQKLDVQVPENLPSLFGDKDLIGVAITNLLSNAIKYTPEGGQIALRAEVEEGGVAIEVADTGIGIPPEIQGQVFERFSRSDQEEVQRQSGTGLGLSLVREIAQIHEGRVTLESALGQGSRFRLWLPSREAGGRIDLGAAA